VNQRPTGTTDAESSPLLEGSTDDVDKTFSLALDRELEKICSFYQLKELEIYGELDAVLKEEEQQLEDLEDLEAHSPISTRPTTARPPSPRIQRSQSAFNRGFSFGRRRRANTIDNNISEDSDEESETAPLRLAKSVDMGKLGQQPDETRSDFRSSRRRSSFFEDYNDMALSALYDTGITLKKSLISTYVSLCELKSFINLNRTGFTKVLKKYDKVVDRRLKNAYITQHVVPAYPFLETTMDQLKQNITKVEEAYAKLVTQDNLEEARRELRLHLREHVVWERNTVWREMIGIERKGQAANLGLRSTILGDPAGGASKNAGLQGDDEHLLKELLIPVGKWHLPVWLFSPSFYTILLILAVFLIILSVPILDQPEQQNCLAMVVFVSLMWATEVCLALTCLNKQLTKNRRYRFL
jgi:phosphate transporter